MPSSLQACSNTNTTSKVWHPINTLALAELSGLALKDPDQDYVDTDQSYEINISKLSFYKSSFIPDSQVTQKMTVELRSLGNQLNSDKKEYYLSRVDYLDSVLSKVPRSLSSMTTIILLTITFAVSLINVILI